MKERKKGARERWSDRSDEMFWTNWKRELEEVRGRICEEELARRKDDNSILQPR